jgi:23S rRNA pseudouridine1911/1915/1917 synthase
MTIPRIVTADRGDTGRRLDLVLRRHLTDIDTATRTRVQTWIEDGRVTVNGTIVRRVAVRAALGDVVAVVLPDGLSPHVMTAEAVTLDVLYEDGHLLALDKPAGVVVHPGYRNTEGTLLNAVLWHARRWPAPQRPSIVGRLDKLTSGIVIVAKSAGVHAALQRTMGSTDTRKDYLALVYGRLKEARGEIDLRLGRDPSDRRRVVASTRLGAPSLTRFERIARGGCRSWTRRSPRSCGPFRARLSTRGASPLPTLSLANNCSSRPPFRATWKDCWQRPTSGYPAVLCERRSRILRTT